MLLDPRHQANQGNNGSNDQDPKLEMQHILIKRRLGRRGNGRKRQDQDHIAAGAMIFPHGLGVIDAAEQCGDVVLRDADEGLEEEEDVDKETEDVVRGTEVGAVVGEFVVFDDDEAAQQGQNAGTVEDGVDGGALLFLGGGVRGLEHEDGLGC